MNKDVYTWKIMRSDLKADCKRYHDFRGEKNTTSFIANIRTITLSRGLWAIIHYRFGRWVNTNFDKPIQKPIKIMLKFLYFIGRVIVVYITKTELGIMSKIGPGVFISNHGYVIFGAENMGKNGTVHHHITSGQGRDRKLPTYGDHVWIGPNSMIYGGISVGNNTVITGSTVLSKNVPGNMLVGGNPCKIIKKKIASGPHPFYFHMSKDKDDI